MHVAALDQNHVGDRGGEDLCVRLQVEERVLCHGILADLAHSKGLVEDRLSMSRNQYNGSRDQPAIDPVLQARCHVVESSLRHAYLGGASLLQCATYAAGGVGERHCLKP